MKSKMSVIKNYEFKDFSEKIEKESYFEKSFDDHCLIDKRITNKERKFAKNNNFDIHPILRDKRGIMAQESELQEEIVESEVQKRLEEVRENAFAKGYQEGKAKGENDVYEQTKIEAGEKLDMLSEIINEVLKSKIRLIREEKSHIYGLIRKLVKWIILRELSNDGDYLKRLLDNLASEIEGNSDLVVYLDQESFKNMPEFVDYAQEKLKNFKNVKVKIGHDIEGVGIMLCSESEIISGTMEDQFKSLEKIFSSCMPEEAGFNGSI